MPLINTDGLTVFGDGSQWFWSMLAFLAVPITGYVIYSQLRLARSIRAREQVEGLDREWDSERMMRPGWSSSTRSVTAQTRHICRRAG